MFDIRTFDYVRLFKSVRLPNVRLCSIGRKILGGFTKPNRQVNRTIGVRARPGGACFGNSEWKVNGKVTFRKFQSKIEEYVLR